MSSLASMERTLIGSPQIRALLTHRHAGLLRFVTQHGTERITLAQVLRVALDAYFREQTAQNPALIVEYARWLRDGAPTRQENADGTPRDRDRAAAVERVLADVLG